MKLHDFIPGIAYRTISLYGFSPETAGQWRAASEMLFRSFERLGVRPNAVGMESVPGLNEDAEFTVDEWRDWYAGHQSAVPRMVAVDTGYFGRMDIAIGPLDTKTHGNITAHPEGGQFLLFSDAALQRWLPAVYGAIVQDAWSVKSFEYGYAHTHRDPIRFAAGFGGVRNELHWKWLVFMNNMTREGHRYSERLRDVFPLNYLVDNHLNLRFGQQTLGEWITASQTRGLLTRLAPGLWCWSVPDNVIPQVRTALKPSGFLVAPGDS